MKLNFNHVSVLREQCITGLSIKKGGIYVDGTLGGAGHSFRICEELSSTGRLIGIDQDINAINKSKEILKDFSNVTYVRNNFSNITNILDELEIDFIDGILLDLGVSSHQLDERERGFSYMQDAPLDMRMDIRQTFTAYDVINNYEKKDLERVIYDYGEEKWTKRIVEFIIKEREIKPIETTFELVEIIKKAIPKKAREDGHPAKRTFQAVRIEVNNELLIIKDTIKNVWERMNIGGRICIITFHSLEDRIVKHTFKELAESCICPKEFPICVCNNKPKIKLVNRKPIVADETEVLNNSRSKSAKLRIAEKI